MTLLVSVQATVSPAALSQRKDMFGCVHYYKNAMLNRFYAICNCCACCCGAMQAWRHGTPMLASSGYISHVDTDLCVGCDTCSSCCPFGALSLNDATIVVDSALCMGCGACVSRCREGALTLVRDPTRSEPLEIRELIASASSTPRNRTDSTRLPITTRSAVGS